LRKGWQAGARLAGVIRLADECRICFSGHNAAASTDAGEARPTRQGALQGERRRMMASLNIRQIGA